MTHPARYTPSILDAFAELAFDLAPESWVLDPFAGTGERLSHLAAWRGWRTVLLELEPNFAGPACTVADSTRMPLPDACIDAAMTSVTYANGMSDKGLRMKNPKGRRTYDLANGRPLHRNNTGAYGVRQGTAAYVTYLGLHRRVFLELARVLKPGALFLMNCSDCYRNGELCTITDDNIDVAREAGFQLERIVTVLTPRYRNGANAEARVDGEHVVVLRSPRRAPSTGDSAGNTDRPGWQDPGRLT